MDTMDTGSTFAPFDLAVAGEDGERSTETLTGRVLGADGPITVYLIEDGRVMIHDEDEAKLWPTSAEEVGAHLGSSPEAYAAACAALGIDPEVASAIEGASTDPDSN